MSDVLPEYNQESSDTQEYTRWKTQMDKHGYTWEAHPVTTSDGFVLTTFHITGTNGSGPFKPTKGAVLIQHGNA